MTRGGLLPRLELMWLRLRHRIEEKCRARGILYPWWIPVISFVGQVSCVLLALGVRDHLWPLHPLQITLLLVAIAPVVQIGFGRWLPWYLDVLGAFLAAGWLMADPVAGELSVLDTAPALLMLVTAEATARDGAREGAVVGVLSSALVAAAAWQFATFGGAANVLMHVLMIVLGYVVGVMLLWQMRALAAERAAREQAWQQATLAERQRIAREIHDLVAHSLSVTLLHLTGARHALRDLGDDEAAADVDGALRDAEQIGRQAMADIRRTVGSLADGPTEVHALPGADGIAALAQQMRDAGLSAEYVESGDPATLPPVVGLGFYRIAQESLTNVAKHAATATAHVELTVDDRGARLAVRNALVGADGMLGRSLAGRGSGLAGMAARADQLGARLRTGPDDGDWVVELRLSAAKLARFRADRPEVAT